MDKSRILLSAIGQSGGNIVDGLMSKNKRYNGLFINSSIGDIKPLNNADIDKNVFIFPGADGSGRDRRKAEEMTLENTNTLGTLIRRYPQTKVMVVFIGMGGGTGSGSINKFIQIAKRALPDIKINIVAILPSLKEDELSLRNALECWNDINKVMHLINDIKLVDNSKRDNYEDINKEVIEHLDLAYNIMGTHKEGTIDQNDSMRINTAEGYGLVMKLKDGESDSAKAIDEALKSSVFAQPSSYDCDYIGVNVKLDGYNPNKVIESFDVYKTAYKTYNTKFNMIVLGGMEIPSESLELLQIELDDKKKKKGSRIKSRGFVIDLDDDSENKENDNKSKKVDIYDDEDDFDLLFDDSFIHD